MFEKLQEKHPDYRKLVVHIGAGAITALIAFVYFYSVFANKINAQASAKETKEKTQSPTQELIKSIIFVGKEAGNVVKTTISDSKETQTPEESSEPAKTDSVIVDGLPEEDNPYTTE